MRAISVSWNNLRFGVLSLTFGIAAVAVIPAAKLSADDKPTSSKAKTVATKTDPSARSGDAERIKAINQRLADKWKSNKLKPSDKASDYEFVRRATLDIIGRIAKPKELEQFFKDPDSTRRSLLIDRLLKSDEYAKNWANIWTVWLLTRSGQNDEVLGTYHKQMHRWLEEQFTKEGTSWKEVVTDLLTATGKTNENGAVNYILAHLGEPNPPGEEKDKGKYTMIPITSRTTRLFLGKQTQCAQCHPHPFNKEMPQSDFWGINAFFRQIDTPKGRPPEPGNRMMRSTVLELAENASLNPKGNVFYEQRDGVIRTTKANFFPSKEKKEKVELQDGGRRPELARQITNDPYFGRAYVNRIWAHFFGKGFTNPIDDFSPDNEESHPELLDDLSAEFVHYGYDPRKLIRWICNSDAYNLSSVANKTNEDSETERFFSRMLLKSLTPEQLFESLIVSTQAEMFESRENKEKIRRDWMKSLTTNFGDDEGNEVTFNGTVVQALMMMNGSEINNSVASKDKGTVALGVVTKKTPKAIMDYLYVSALNRLPRDKEATKILDIYKSAPVKSKDGLSFWQDLFWALLNSNEFMLNH